MLELDNGVCGRKKECVGAGISGGGPPWAHEAGARPPPSWPGGCPPAVFSVPNILKYSRKKSYLNFRAFGELLFLGYFYIAHIIQITDRKYYFLLYLI